MKKNRSRAPPPPPFWAPRPNPPKMPPLCWEFFIPPCGWVFFHHSLEKRPPPFAPPPLPRHRHEPLTKETAPPCPQNRPNPAKILEAKRPPVANLPGGLGVIAPLPPPRKKKKSPRPPPPPPSPAPLGGLFPPPQGPQWPFGRGAPLFQAPRKPWILAPKKKSQGPPPPPPPLMKWYEARQWDFSPPECPGFCGPRWKRPPPPPPRMPYGPAYPWGCGVLERDAAHKGPGGENPQSCFSPPRSSAVPPPPTRKVGGLFFSAAPPPDPGGGRPQQGSYGEGGGLGKWKFFPPWDPPKWVGRPPRHPPTKTAPPF